MIWGGRTSTTRRWFCWRELTKGFISWLGRKVLLTNGRRFIDHSVDVISKRIRPLKCLVEISWIGGRNDETYWSIWWINVFDKYLSLKFEMRKILTQILHFGFSIRWIWLEILIFKFWEMWTGRGIPFECDKERQSINITSTFQSNHVFSFMNFEEMKVEGEWNPSKMVKKPSTSRVYF